MTRKKDHLVLILKRKLIIIDENHLRENQKLKINKKLKNKNIKIKCNKYQNLHYMIQKLMLIL